MLPTSEERIQKALQIALEYGGASGERHKAYAIDQMVRALTGCPIVLKHAVDADGRAYAYETQGESNEYDRFVADFENGEDGPDTYEWDPGLAP